MKKILTALAILISGQVFSQASFDREQVNVGNLQLSVTNSGTLGNPVMASNPDDNHPSMMYPKASGIEHLFEGGLWLGARVAGQKAVSTASVDAATGYSTGAAGFEFTADIGNQISQRSSLTGSSSFSLSAISHQDLLVDFSDKNTIVPGTTTTIDQHTIPLGAAVHLETYAWNYSYADYFVILNYTITNNSTTAWDTVYSGIWSDLVVRNVNVTNATGTAFFNKGAGGWLDTLNAVYAYDYSGDMGYTNSYGALVYLGSEWRNLFFHPGNNSAITGAGYPPMHCNVNFWRYKDLAATPPYMAGYPPDDITRYLRMGTGVNTAPGNIKFSTADNRTQLVSAGPFLEVLPGESFNFTVALVCAKQSGTSTPHTVDDYATRSQLLSNINWAIRSYKGEDVNNNGVLDTGEDIDGDGILDRYILPSPPADPKVKIIAKNNSLDVYWDNGAENSIDPVSKLKDFEGYRIYLANKGSEIQLSNITSSDLAAQWDKTGNDVGYNNGFDKIKLASPLYFSGDTIAYHYHYHIYGLSNGWQTTLAITSFDGGDKTLDIPSLESSFTGNTFAIYSGTPANESDTAQVGVYPNPYSLNAAWENGNTSTNRKLYFYNLPANCLVTIYTQSGDVVASFEHEAANYNGSDIGWFKTYGGDPTKRIFSGGEHAFDLLSAANQAISQGLYLFTVQDHSTNKILRGKFAVLK